MPLATGSQFAGCRIIAPIGHGGMGIVYKAYQAGLDRDVAIKVLPDFLGLDDECRARFYREARALGRLRHPNILTVHDFGEADGVCYLLTELVAGNSLADRSGAPMDSDRAITILAGIASALDYAHAHGVLHRDLKPANIVLSAENIPILVDFGLAEIVGTLPRLSRTGTLFGTPEYMAPEHGTGEAVGPWTDRYALAIVAYELLTGSVPFSGGTPLAILLAHINSGVPPARTRNSALPEAIERALAKGLAKRPEDRYPTAAALVEALACATAGAPIAGTAARAASPTARITPFIPTVPRARSRAWPGWLAAAAALIVLGGTILVGAERPLAADHAGGVPPPDAGGVFLTADAPGMVVRADTFDDPSVGWLPTFTRPFVRVGYEGGRYYVRKTDPAPAAAVAVLPGTYADASLAVDAAYGEGVPGPPVMLVCRAQDPNISSSGYRLWVDTGTGLLRVNRGFAPADGSPLVDWTRSSAIQPGGATNRIELACVRDAISVRVNGVAVASTQDATYSQGLMLVGMAASQGTADLWLDNLVVTARTTGR